MKTDADLRALLERIDRRSYPAYKDTKGSYHFGTYTLHIDHVQGDPFAAPSHITVQVKGANAGFPREYYETPHRRIALEDYLIRSFHTEALRYDHKAGGSGKSGKIETERPGQEIVERSACRIDPQTGDIYFRLYMGFPANGRTINARELEKMLYEYLPGCVAKALFFRPPIRETVKAVIELADDQKALREALEELSLCAFVADGSILPRKSGISQQPMKEAIPFSSPDSLRVTVTLPHRGEVQGMGMKRGITLIVGGGYHGKSTLLKALERGVYNHIAGDGRELVVTDDTAFKIRAEDGRSIHGTDISMFIRDLPDRTDTRAFSTEDASGSTSQAANVIEAIESGVKTLLIDEDTCATNFMIRDELMQKVISRDNEPITPFIERIRPLWEKEGISTVLVAGSFGSYFHVADTIIQMKEYKPIDITGEAKEAAQDYPLPQGRQEEEVTLPRFGRKPVLELARSRREGGRDGARGGRDGARGGRDGAREERIKVKSMGRDGFLINHDEVELRYVEQLLDGGQTLLLAKALLYAHRHLFGGGRTVTQCVDAIMERLEQYGPEGIDEGSYAAAGFTAIRRQDLFAAFNRCRFLKMSV